MDTNRRTFAFRSRDLPRPAGPRPLDDFAHAHEADPLIGQSSAFLAALERMKRVAPTDSTVLITGETGTGKELVAQSLHLRSRRGTRPLVTLNLGALPESLMASELFGHEAGAFTGATHRRVGRFELADQGTLCLDEVGELTHDVQVMLLRVLQEGEIARLGASQTLQVDVRLIAVTNRDLRGAMEAGTFREDLFYRLSVFPIHLPPLRERPDDIPALVTHFLRQLERRLCRRFDGVDPESLERLSRFTWPGNIRQLDNVIEQSAILSDDSCVTVPPSLLVERHTEVLRSPLRASVLDNERRQIEQILAETHGRISGLDGAATRLGVPASTLESKIRRFNIDKLRYRGVHREAS
jgi:transcriptional regulator with GAF, ATPase, and Fis domain